MNCTRRRFLQQTLTGCSFLALNPLWKGSLLTAGTSETLHEAQHYEVGPDGTIHCGLCPNACIRAEGVRSKCRVREPREGKYYSLVYGQPCVLALDPLEKCPLFHYKAGLTALTSATAGSNLGCQYCQNWQFSQNGPENTKNYVLKPAEVVQKALEYKAGAISFFYTEPTIYFEYMKDIATEARRAKLPCVMVTAGYINEKPLTELFPLIDAFVVGLKGFSDDYYQKVVGGTLAPVLATLKTIARAKAHLEVVTLLVPSLNDQMDDIQKEIDWIGSNLGREVPLHFTRFNPQFRLKGLPPTPVVVMEEARNRAMKAGLHYVYTGNIPAHEGNHTFCPGCKKIVIERLGFKVIRNTLAGGKCPHCGKPILGIW